jgi:prolyl oligopeptidase
MIYPNAPIDDVTDVLAGVRFPDPYRWLEQESDEVRQWQQAQAELASKHVREWPQFERLKELVAQFNVERRVTLPRYSAGRWFRTRIAGGASQAHVLVSDEPLSDGRVLFDPVKENSERPPFVSWIAPSPDGRTLALGVCTDGSENNTIRLVDVDTGRLLPDAPLQTLMDNWTGGVQWMPDSSGFFFSAITGAAIDFEQMVYLHRRLPTPTTVLVDIPWTGAKEYRMVTISRDGHHAVALERLHNPIPVAFAVLDEVPLSWQPFVTSVDGTVAGHVIAGRYIAVTDVGAPRGRLVAISLDADDPNNPETWHELVAQSSAVLRTVTPVADTLYLTEFVDTYARVRIVASDGRTLGEVPLPGRGAISEMPYPMMNLVPKGHPQKFLFAFSSLTSSWGIYSHALNALDLKEIQAPQARLEGVVVEDHRALSTDGTYVPYHLVRRTDVNPDRPQPTLVYAYGGFNSPLVPQFPGAMAAFIAAGGTFVLAHLRGGGEFGLDWWRSGRLSEKQNGYDDLYAVAEDLIATYRSTPRLLAVTGRSNGGLMAGVAATQRPDLWKVIVPQVPILDLVGGCRDAYGRMCIMAEYANVERAEEVHRLASFSPYHLVRTGVQYPAIFVDAGNTDPRCPPWHARKFVARLQRAATGDGPILLHVWENVGHGWANDKNIVVTAHTEWLAFTLRHLGVQDWT